MSGAVTGVGNINKNGRLIIVKQEVSAISRHTGGP